MKQAKAPRKTEAFSVHEGFKSRTTIGEIVGLARPISLELLREGLPTASVDELGNRLNITQRELIALLGISKRTFARRKESGVLNVDESDRVVRYGRLLALAIELFEDDDAAAQWLKTQSPALGGETPLVHANTGMGARNVERLIGRLEHGIPT